MSIAQLVLWSIGFCWCLTQPILQCRSLMYLGRDHFKIWWSVLNLHKNCWHLEQLVSIHVSDPSCCIQIHISEIILCCIWEASTASIDKPTAILNLKYLSSKVQVSFVPVEEPVEISGCHDHELQIRTHRTRPWNRCNHRYWHRQWRHDIHNSDAGVRAGRSQQRRSLLTQYNVRVLSATVAAAAHRFARQLARHSSLALLQSGLVQDYLYPIEQEYTPQKRSVLACT